MSVHSYLSISSSMLRINSCMKACHRCKTSVQSKLPSHSKIDFTVVRHPTKVPLKPLTRSFPPITEKVEICIKTIQLLERLSLVDVGSKAALKTLEDSVTFANQVIHIDTTNVNPLYTVLENHMLHLREDNITEGNIKDNILKNVSVTEEDYFVAPPGNIPLLTKDKSF